MNIGEVMGGIEILSFRNDPNNCMGFAEACGKIEAGDVLIGVNGRYIGDLSFSESTKVLVKFKKHLAFTHLRVVKQAVSQSLPHRLSCF